MRGSEGGSERVSERECLVTLTRGVRIDEEREERESKGDRGGGGGERERARDRD